MPNAAGSRVSRTGVIRAIESFRRIASSLSSPAWEHDPSIRLTQDILGVLPEWKRLGSPNFSMRGTKVDCAAE